MNLKIRTKLLLAFGAIAAVLVILGVYGLVSILRLDAMGGAAAAELTKDAHTAMVSMVVMAAVAVGLCIIWALLLSAALSRQFKRAVEAAARIAAGDPPQDLLTNQHDEGAELMNTLACVADAQSEWVAGVLSFADALQSGAPDATIDARRFKGKYAAAAVRLNEAARGVVGSTTEVAGCLERFAEGHFDATISGTADTAIGSALRAVGENLKAFAADAAGLANAVSAGDFSVRLDSERYKNDWAVPVRALNGVAESAAAPINDVVSVMAKIAGGDLHTQTVGTYQGEYAALTTGVNQAVTQLSRYVTEISSALGEIARDNLNVNLTQEYTCDFAMIGEALRGIIKSFNETLYEIGNSAEQVAAGARHIANSSMALAQGASQQTEAVDRLAIVLDALNEKTHKSAEESRSANRLAADASENASVGNTEMGSMLKAMEEINEISSNMSKIIKTIDDIAFQTNLLALNAAVEAARAGQHGKGFAVVADEVRNLSNRCKKSAQDIAQFLQGSVEKIDEGTRIANQTAKSLAEIVEQISDISNMIGGFAEVAAAQEKGIAEVSESIGQIASVTQTNTASSEEEAAFSEELSSQAEVFKSLVAKFVLRPGTNEPPRRTNDKVVELRPAAEKPRDTATPKPVAAPRPTATPRPPANTAPKPAEEPRAVVVPKPAEEPRAVVASKPAAEPKPIPAAARPKPMAPVAPKPGMVSKPAPAAKPAPASKPAVPARTASTPKPAVPARTAPKPAVPVKPAAPAKPVFTPRVESKPQPAASSDQVAQDSLPKNVTPVLPSSSSKRDAVPSGASVYDRRDYGKY